MPKLTVKELDFLRLTGNHLEFSRKLTSLDCPNPDITQYAQYVGAAWFRLGEQHLVEAKKYCLQDAQGPHIHAHIMQRTMLLKEPAI